MGIFHLFYSLQLCLFPGDVNAGDTVAEGVAAIGPNVPEIHLPTFISLSQRCSQVWTLRHTQVFSS